ncbi:MAG: IS66 family transposase [Ginsengibacter sp.]
MALEEKISELESIILSLRNENKELKELLQQALDKLNKNSSNSSKPPSTDIVRTKSLRISAGRKAGGQKGHKGVTLPISEVPDKIVIHRALECSGCGKDISGVGSLRFERRQVYDIPPIRMRVCEHKSEIKCCPHCEKENKGVFPEEVSHCTQYGRNLKRFGVYLTQYQLLPLGRSAQLIEDLTGHKLSAATLVNINEQCSVQLSGFIEALKENLQKEPVMHSDETGFYYESKRNWLHVATTSFLTYYFAHEKRGKEAMDQMGILGDYKGIVMHDYWKSYLDYLCDHSLCNVHHLRDLTFCHEQETSQWAADMKTLLLEMKAATDKSKEMGLQSLNEQQQQQFTAKYDLLIKEGYLQHPFPEKQPGKRGAVKKSKTQNLLERFKNHREDIIRFIRDFRVPFGNNLAEQAVRMMKLKQKISGCFRSKQGAVCFATTRSYIDTMRKNGFCIMDAIGRAIIGKAIMPFDATYTYPQSG